MLNVNNYKDLLSRVVKGNEKAIVGFLTPLVLGALIGIKGDMTVEEAVGVLITSVVTSATVWFKANS